MKRGFFDFVATECSVTRMAAVLVLEQLATD